MLYFQVQYVYLAGSIQETELTNVKMLNYIDWFLKQLYKVFQSRIAEWFFSLFRCFINVQGIVPQKIINSVICLSILS